MRAFTSLLAGLVFGFGLIIGGMTNPAKVQNFLDVTGSWDPSLIFVMGGGIAVTMPAFAYLKRQRRPLFAEAFSWPVRTDLDPRLLTGSTLFGLGWGLGGFCPGPALTALPSGAFGGVVFVLAMLAGICFAKVLAHQRLPKPENIQ